MATSKELISAVTTIKEHCEKAMERRCLSNKCVFGDGTDCILRDYPHNWEPPAIRRFTDEDIALAKALKAFGVTAIGMDESNLPYMRDGHSYKKLPYTAFTALEINEEIGIDTIIAEGEK